MAATAMPEGGEGGVVLGDAVTDKVGFYGTTPVVQPAATAQSAVATTAITTTAGDNAVVAALVARVEAMRVLQAQTRTDLVALGLQKGSA
jgi:hypothetical protein